MALTAPSRTSVFNLPNQLTAARFLLGLVLFVLIELGLWLGCVVVFALAAVTDWLDGYLARRQNLTSSLGRQMDPLVDKVVICGAFIFLLPVVGSGLTAWMVTVVVGRELIITGLRGFLESRGAIFGADWLGKFKMGLQCAALFVIFGLLMAAGLAIWEDETFRSTLLLFRDLLLYVTVGITALSGLQYLWRAALLLKED
jgi:CDP-diacylglycerol--glycerol-3-phosphate 3-phosphatidyltransferase